MYSVFVLDEMHVEYSIRRVINRREYPSSCIRYFNHRAGGSKKAQPNEKGNFIYTEIEGTKVLVA